MAAASAKASSAPELAKQWAPELAELAEPLEPKLERELEPKFGAGASVPPGIPEFPMYADQKKSLLRFRECFVKMSLIEACLSPT